MTIRRIFALLLLLLLCAPAACAPIVTHGPQPERGWQAVATIGLPYPLCDIECEVNLMNQVGFGARYGRPAENGKVGYSLGGTLSLGMVSSELDLYVQAPTDPEWAVGGGLLLSPAHVMPYVQIGQMQASGSGFYTTHGFVWMPERTDATGMDYEPRAYVKPRYWTPTVAYRFARRRGAVHLYLSGAFGTMTLRDASGWDQRPVPGRASVNYVMGGISIERNLPGF